MAGKQAKTKILLVRIKIIAISLFIAAVSTLRFLLHLPSRLLSKKRRRQSPSPAPQARALVHEPHTSQPARDTLLFIHGFPDCSDMFTTQVQAFVKQGYRCIIVDTPGARGECVRPALSLEETAELVYAAVREKHAGGVTVVGHDWGALYGMLLQERHPEVVRRMAFIDVGKFEVLEVSEGLAMWAYQTLFAFLYMLGDPVGSDGVQWFMRLFKYDVRPIDELRVDMGFGYYFALRNPDVVKTIKTENLKVDDRTVPHLFVYGGMKAIRFHDERWVEFVRQSPCGEVARLACDHWVSVHAADEFNRILGNWLTASEEAAGKVGRWQG